MAKNYLDQKFGFWVVTSPTYSCLCGKYKIYKVKALCSACNTEREVFINDLKRGKSTSCGCINLGLDINKFYKNRKRKRLYNIWQGMIYRCHYTNKVDELKYYRNKGIIVCNEWRNFDKFRIWSEENGYKDSLTIDRINSNGNYEPTNCRWIEGKLQHRNKSNNVYITYDNETKTIAEWAEDKRCKVSKNTFKHRIQSDWDISRAMNEELNQSCINNKYK